MQGERHNIYPIYDFIISILNIDSSKIKSLDTIQHLDTYIDVFITLNEEPVFCPYCHGKVNSLFTKQSFFFA